MQVLDRASGERARTKECEVRGERDARPPGEKGDGETKTDKVAPPLFEVLDPFGESPAGLEPMSEMQIDIVTLKTLNPSLKQMLDRICSLS